MAWQAASSGHQRKKQKRGSFHAPSLLALLSMFLDLPVEPQTQLHGAAAAIKEELIQEL
jgi:hypothetical protein